MNKLTRLIACSVLATAPLLVFAQGNRSNGAGMDYDQRMEMMEQRMNQMQLMMEQMLEHRARGQRGQ